MGVIMRKTEYPDLHRYEPEYNEDGTEKHIVCDGARFHVVSWSGGLDGARERCSEPNCEINRRGSMCAAMVARLVYNTGIERLDGRGGATDEQ